ncbi:MAG: hypothetical protein DRJ01_05300 [Bacteroidetes bacterium]|nr:MAG: hypothetical protein DRJ01_05300 [Bacteroidota bacterium]
MNIIYNDFKLWQKIVKSNDDIDVYYLPEYLKVFENNGDGKSQIAIVYNNDKDFLIFPYFIREIESTQLFDIITPYGYGGALCKSSTISTEIFYKDFEDYCINNNIVSEFIRFHLFDSNPKLFNGELKNTNDVVIVDTRKSIDVIEREYNRSVRKNIRTAIKNEVNVIIDKDFKYLEEFYVIYQETMKKNNALKYYYFDINFFEDIAKYLKNNAILFHSIYQDRIVASELVIYSKYYSYSFLGGSLDEYIHLRTNNILKHKIIEWSNHNLIKYFILGGGYTKDDGIFRYKKNFSKSDPLNFYVGKKIIMKNQYFDLLDIFRRKINMSILDFEKVEFFPKYRYKQNN